ncbi:MAG: SDR family oxidoreductase [Planctomycetota bacterium]|nr:MAG: SDR family oxidoreductase [Planctomycetota bacterium]
MKRLLNKTVLITGGGRGIGLAMGKTFLQEGANLAILDFSKENLENAQKILNGEPFCIQGDVSQKEDVERAFQKILERFGDFHVLVNNAGIIRPAMVHKMEEKDWDAVIEVHLKGSFLCTQEAAKYWIQKWKAENAQENHSSSSSAPNSRGKIINISSIAGLRGTIGQVNYASAKSGILGLTMASARELGKYRINVNALAFGVLETEMSHKIRTDPKLREVYLNQIVLGRFGTVEEAARVALFLASSDSDYITGQILNMDGGFHIGL